MRLRPQLRSWFVVPTVVLGLASIGAQERLGPHAPESWPLWESYKTQFYDHQGRIVDHDDGDRTTSEAQAYGMFFSLVANDRDTFGGLLRWTQKAILPQATSRRRCQPGCGARRRMVRGE